MLHSYHCHPRISAGMHGPMVGNQRLHVRQGEVDATCGYHCVLMALRIPRHGGHDSMLMADSVPA